MIPISSALSDTEMITEIEIIEGGVTVEAGIGTNVTDTVGGIEITVDEVEAEVPVLITPEAVAEADMMIIAGVLVDRLAGFHTMSIEFLGLNLLASSHSVHT